MWVGMRRFIKFGWALEPTDAIRLAPILRSIVSAPFTVTADLMLQAQIYTGANLKEINKALHL